MGLYIKHIFLVVLKKSICAIVKGAKQVLSIEHHFYLKEQLINWLFILGWLAYIFSKINEESLSLQFVIGNN